MYLIIGESIVVPISGSVFGLENHSIEATMGLLLSCIHPAGSGSFKRRL
jgi:hypothetical protein